MLVNKGQLVQLQINVNKVKDALQVIGFVLVGIILPSLAAMFVGNDIAQSFNWEPNTYGAVVLRIFTAMVFVSLSALFLFKNMNWED